jgi:hypothetical protein
MPYQFTFLKDNKPEFECDLKKLQCEHINPNNQHRCRRYQFIGCGLCWQHLESDRHLKIKPSTLPNAGLGLFAYDKNGYPDILFRKDDFVIKYDGEHISNLQLNNRYGGNEATAPYAVEIKSGYNEDAACQRTPASLVNRKSRTKANARLSTNFKFVMIKATKNIRNGDEIFVDYGKKYKMSQPGYSFQTKYYRSN